jgi:hypothetical protein
VIWSAGILLSCYCWNSDTSTYLLLWTFLKQIWLIAVDKLKDFARRYIVPLNLILHGDGMWSRIVLICICVCYDDKCWVRTLHNLIVFFYLRHYYQPWRDPALQHTAIERMEVEQACRSLLIIFSNTFSAGLLPGVPVLSLGDVEKSGLFQWERNSMIKQPHS